MKTHTKTLLAGLTASAMIGSANAATVLFEDFEDATVTYTTNFTENTDLGYDYWLRTDGSDINASVIPTSPPSGSSFFAASDIGSGLGITPPAIQTFSGLNITGLTDLQFSVDAAAVVNQGYGGDDIVLFEYQIDGGGYAELFRIVATTGVTPGINGTNLTATFAEFSDAIVGTGDTLDIRISWTVTGSGTGTYIDDVTVTGVVPEPGSLALLAAGGLLIGTRRRRD